jgi:Antitoxin Xre/MbcA/ParS C-terminal toxin-binding domain/Antitoxin Xre-like helix-turn-helix domain
MEDPLEEEAPPAHALRSSEARGRLARMVVRLFEHWGLSLPEQAGLLGLSISNRASIARYRAGAPLADSRDLLDRVSCLLGIHKTLRILFPHNRDLAYRWMSSFNRRLQQRPVDLVLHRGFEGLIAVRRYLEVERGQ